MKTKSKLIKNHINELKKITAFTFLMLSAEYANAAGGGLQNGTSVINKIIEWLDVIALAVVTLAFMVAGYKVLFGGRTIQEVLPIAIGGLLLGSAGYLAKLILGK